MNAARLSLCRNDESVCLVLDRNDAKTGYFKGYAILIHSADSTHLRQFQEDYRQFYHAAAIFPTFARKLMENHDS